MIAASLFHIGYVTFTARGRRRIRDLWWRPKDLRDAIGLVKYNLGLSREKPQLDRFSYIEKSEYWALVWGTAVMAITGVVMWFDNTFIGILTKLGYDVSRTIHFYEAWLATLAILVWHIYWVVLNPEAYPMNMAWLTGNLSEKEMKRSIHSSSSGCVISRAIPANPRRSQSDEEDPARLGAPDPFPGLRTPLRSSEPSLRRARPSRSSCSGFTSSSIGDRSSPTPASSSS